MTLAYFLRAFFDKLTKQEIAYCVLRNYDGLPSVNLSNDIDVLINPKEKKAALKQLLSIPGVQITSFIERPYVVSVFIYGVEWGDGCKAIQVDFITSLSWKGLPYLDVEQVLTEVRSPENADDIIKVPSFAHEAIISFMSSYLVGGWIKEKYQGFVLRVFSSERIKINEILKKYIGERGSKGLVSVVCGDEKNQILSLRKRIIKDLIKRSFTKNPFISVKSVLVHYLAELKIRYSPHTHISVCVLGPDGVGKSTVINRLFCELKNTIKIIHCRHLKPNYFRKQLNNKSVVNPHGKSPRSTLTSTIKIFAWCLELWWDCVFHGYKNITLRIWDRYYHDILIDPRRYRFGGSERVAALICTLIPQPGLFLVLDAPPEVAHGRKQEVPLSETQRQREAYLAFARHNKNCIVINTDQDIEQTLYDARSAVLDFMSKRLERRMRI